MRLDPVEMAVARWAVDIEMEPYDVLVAMRPEMPLRPRSVEIADAKLLILRLIQRGVLEMERRVVGDTVNDVTFVPMRLDEARVALDEPRLWDIDDPKRLRDVFVIIPSNDATAALG